MAIMHLMIKSSMNSIDYDSELVFARELHFYKYHLLHPRVYF
jgi:hypothetical protein